MQISYGPVTDIAEQTHAVKYRQEGENFYEAMCRVANALKDTEEHRKSFKDILLNQRFMPGGRVQSCMGAAREVTPYNCFVSATIEDSMGGIMKAATDAAQTMRMGGGIGYDFSTLRPKGDRIVSLGAPSSGPVSFMQIFDAVCKTISSAGNRRGAQMGVLRIDHPDIREFIHAKQNSTALTAFNVSVGVTDEFMKAVESGGTFDLQWGGRVYDTINAAMLWEEIMRGTYDWAEPGVLFIDRINNSNNLYYCEEIAATNPCAEQPLPPSGACLLGSFNLTKYVHAERVPSGALALEFNWLDFASDIPHVVRAMDNIVDRAIYPLESQEQEAKYKRRMGLGVTGLANAGEALGYPYGSEAFLKFTADVLTVLRDGCYSASCDLAAEKGSFPLYAPALWASEFIQTLPGDLQDRIKLHGLRNSHLLSIAPTGTISLCADNVSSGIEPIFAYSTMRTIQTVDGPIVVEIADYGVRKWSIKGRRADDISVEDHLGVLLVAQQYIDSAVSKTCNVGDDVTWEQFQDVYMQAWKGGAKGITTFRAAGKRFGILNSNDETEPEGEACFIDPTTGDRTCD